MKTVVLILALVIAVIRPMLLFVELNEHVQSSYEAVAHLLVGGLFAWYFAKRGVWEQQGGAAYVKDDFDWTVHTAMALTSVEIVCAVISVAT